MPVELIHTMVRILDEDRSLAFYRALGFEERGRKRVVVGNHVRGRVD